MANNSTEDQMKEILTSIGLEQCLDKFCAEKVYAKTVELLTTDQLKELGVRTIGEQAILREACKRSHSYTKVASEVKRIMQPSLPLDNQPSTSGISSLRFDRRKVRKRKGGYNSTQTPNWVSPSAGSIKTKVPATFQKRLVVLKNMGKHQLQSFSISHSVILFRGILSEISIEASEQNIREEILSVLHNCKEFELSSFTSSDFEFIDVCGKQGVIPVCRGGQEWNAKCVKQIAGVGAIYIRLTRQLPTRRSCLELSDDSDFEKNAQKQDHDPIIPIPPTFILDSMDSDSSFDLPSPITPSSYGIKLRTRFPQQTSNQSGSSMISPEPLSAPPSTSTCTGTTSQSEPLSTTRTIIHVATSQPEPTPSTSIGRIDMHQPEPPNCVDLTRANSPATSDPTQHPSNLQELLQMYPSHSLNELSTLHEAFGFNIKKTIDLLRNCTIDNLLALLRETYLTTDTEESPKIKINRECSAIEMTDSLLGFYKGNRFDRNAHVQIVMQGQCVIDSGGVRRQFYCQALESFALGYHQIFEGPLNRLRTATKPSNIVSGTLKHIGIAIGHSLLMDEIGFRYLSPPLFYYLVGKENVAITLLNIDDTSGQAAHVLSKIKSSSGDKLVNDESDLHFIETLLNEADSDVSLEVCNKYEIFQTILVHNALHKRKAFLDSLAEGLEVYKLHSLMKIFPELFKPNFTFKQLQARDVIVKIVPMAIEDKDSREVDLVSTLFDFLSVLTSKDLQCFLALVTGSYCLTPDAILLKFTSREIDPAFSFHTCSRTMVISTLINCIEMFKMELNLLIQEKSFTMP